MKVLVISCLALVGIVVIVGVTAYLFGRSLPAQHVAEGSILVNAGIEQVADRIRHVDQQPQWRGQVSSVTIESQNPGVTNYQEHSGRDRIAFVLYEREEGRSFESRITDPELPFGGRWLIELTPKVPGGTLVRIREEGVVHAPIYRVLSKYVFRHDSTSNKYLTDLAASFQSGAE